MPINEGRADRIIRMVMGLALITSMFVGPKTPWGLVGILPLATALIGFCPLYRLLGVSTCSNKT